MISHIYQKKEELSLVITVIIVMEEITKGIAMTTRQPDLLPIDIENSPEANIKYIDKE